MKTINQHIDQQHGGNLSAFARSVGVTRPTAYSWAERGAMWYAGRVWDPLTPAPPVIDWSTAPDWAESAVKLSHVKDAVYWYGNDEFAATRTPHIVFKACGWEYETIEHRNGDNQ